MFQVYNFTDRPVLIPAGERIGQGVFMKYFKTDDDVASGIREGGFGSTSDNMTKSQNATVSDMFLKDVFGINPFTVDRQSMNDHISSEEDPQTGDFQND